MPASPDNAMALWELDLAGRKSTVPPATQPACSKPLSMHAHIRAHRSMLGLGHSDSVTEGLTQSSPGSSVCQPASSGVGIATKMHCAERLPHTDQPWGPPGRAHDAAATRPGEAPHTAAYRSPASPKRLGGLKPDLRRCAIT